LVLFWVGVSKDLFCVEIKGWFVCFEKFLKLGILLLFFNGLNHCIEATIQLLYRNIYNFSGKNS
jgi:hypothetical protein